MGRKRAKPQGELHNGWWWYCEVCGEANFERAITLSRETLEQVMSVDGDDPDVILFPDDVTCRFCHVEYETTLEDGE